MADWWSTSMDANNWDLYAVVRGRCFSSPTTPATVNPFSSFPTPLLKEECVSGEEDPISFPVLTATEKALNGLEELYKPFFPKTQQHLLLSPQRSSPSPSSSAPVADLQDSAVAGPHQTREMRQPHRSLPHTPRSKRRKNQQKKVVCQVPADGLSSDMWAWRKYGQKPIKGSPYPRGYYRCSSSKGCLARKQVERSRTDSAMLVITYTAEHNHPVPTHRNSLAGTTRNKFPPPSSGGGGDGDQCLPVNNPSFSPLSSSNAAGLSPTTPLTASVEDELLQRRRPLKGEIEDVEDNEEEEEGPVTMGGMLGEDDMIFMELEELAAPLTVAVNTPAAAFSIDSAFCDGDDLSGAFLFYPMAGQ